MTYITFHVKDAFFDRAAVEAAMDKARYKALYKAGAYVRRTARTMIGPIRQNKDKPSSPGKPPRSHETEPSIKTILYFYEPNTDSVVIGPVRLNQVNHLTKGMRVTIPELHEFGGEMAIREWKFNALDERTYDMFLRYPTVLNFQDVWTRRDLRWRMTSRKRPWSLMKLGVQTRVRKAKYPARPFMQPALEKVKDSGKIAELFHDSIRATVQRM
jgi:hypothetical protein